MAEKTWVYLSAGRLYGVDSHGVVEEMESQFANEAKSRVDLRKERNAWKSRDDASVMMGGGGPWSGSGQGSDDFWVSMKSVSPGPRSESLYYFLQTPAVGGMFRYDMEDGYEQRIFHKENVVIAGIRHHPRSKFLVGALEDEDKSHIVMFENSSFGFRHLTDGDSVDLLPSWDMKDQVSVLYQSSGVGRNQDGYAVALGASSIQRVNVKTGDHEILLEKDAYDYLAPQRGADGDLYCIRRPYEGMQKRVPFFRSLKEFVLIPFRMAKTLYLVGDGLSRLLRKKPLADMGRRDDEHQDMKQIWLKGVAMDLSKTASKGDEKNPSVVPATWQLVKWTEQGEESVVESSVLDFDLRENGEIVYTNGRAVYSLVGGKREKLASIKGVAEEVRWV